MRKRELQEQINALQRRTKQLEQRMARAEYELGEMNARFETRVDNHITGRIHYQVIEHLDHYEKGKAIEKDIKHIEEILK